MAHGDTDMPAKPNWMAAMLSWKRALLVAKKTGGLMDTAFFIAVARTLLMSPCPSLRRDAAFTICAQNVRSTQHLCAC